MGLLLVAQAAAEKTRGNFAEATRLLGASNAPPVRLPNRYDEIVSGLRAKWTAEWVDAELSALTRSSRFADARAFVDARLADPGVDGPLRDYLDGVARDLPSLERFHQAVQARIDGDGSEAVERLEALAADPATSDSVRRRAVELLEKIGR